jgi:hypothetical protein
MEILYYVFLVILIGIFIGHYIFTQRLVDKLQSEKSNLLNRLMAKDYKEYAVFEHNKSVLEIEKQSKNIMESQDTFPVN